MPRVGLPGTPRTRIHLYAQNIIDLTAEKVCADCIAADLKISATSVNTYRRQLGCPGSRADMCSRGHADLIRVAVRRCERARCTKRIALNRRRWCSPRCRKLDGWHKPLIHDGPTGERHADVIAVRQVEVARLTAAGLSATQIAVQLGVTPRTVVRDRIGSGPDVNEESSWPIAA